MTLIHNDPNSGNAFLPKNSETHRPLWIDWQTYGRGLAAYDLAYFLLYTNLPFEIRQEMMKRLTAWHYDKLKEGGVTDYSWEDYRYDYQLSVIGCLFPPIMWYNVSPTEAGIYAFEGGIHAFKDWDCAELLN